MAAVALMRSRAAAMQAAYNTTDVPELTFFWAPDGTYSAHVSKDDNMSGPTIAAFFQKRYDDVEDYMVVTNAICGTTDFVAWEMDLRHHCVNSVEPLNLRHGDSVVMKGVCLQHWNDVGGEWKIWKEDDCYFVTELEKTLGEWDPDDKVCEICGQTNCGLGHMSGL